MGVQGGAATWSTVPVLPGASPLVALWLLSGHPERSSPPGRRNVFQKEKCLMFTDGRSKKVIFLAHCLLNQNAISDGTAVYPAAFRELCCLGLDRGGCLRGGAPGGGGEHPHPPGHGGGRPPAAAGGPGRPGGRSDPGVSEARLSSPGHRGGLTAPPTAGWRPPPTRTGSLP